MAATPALPPGTCAKLRMNNPYLLLKGELIRYGWTTVASRNLLIKF